MKFVNTPIEGLVIIEPTVFGDNRGYFLESYNKKEFEKAIGEISFVQDNESKSSKGVLRGLHFQERSTPWHRKHNFSVATSGVGLDNRLT